MKMTLTPRQEGNPKSYAVGDFIDAVEDGMPLGPRVSKTEWVASGGAPEEFMAFNNNLIINLDGVPKSKLISFFKPEFIFASDGEEEVTSKRRLNFLDWASVWPALPQGKKDAVLNDHEVTVTVAQRPAVKNFLKKRIDNSVVDIGI